MEIKICGINRPQDVDYANTSRPDYVGFIVNFPKSHRSVNDDELKNLSQAVNPGIQKVGVYVDSSPQVIVSHLKEGLVDIAQLHGGQDESFIEELRQLTDCPIWKAFSIQSEEDVKAAEESTADVVLLDHGKGGTGEQFDWSLVEEFNRPYFLAGGMNEESIPQALAHLHPAGVDTSSGTETNKIKDPKKIERIVRMVQNDY